MPNTLQSVTANTGARSFVAPTLFVALPTEVQQRLRDGSNPHRFSEGQLVTLRTEEAEGFWLIEAGGVRVGQFSSDGHFHVIAQLGPGDSYGELAVLSGARRVVDAVTLDGTTLRWISAARYERELAADALAGRALLGALALQLQEQLDAMVERQRLSAPERVAMVLARLAGRGNEQTTVNIGQQGLADLVGTTRMTVTTALGRLEAEGLLMRGYGQIEVLNAAGLRNFARR